VSAPGGYPRLVAPLTIGGRTLRNRMVMGAMHTRLETLDRPTERLTAFYAARARGEAALILTGGFAPNAEGRLEEDAQVLAPGSELGPHRAVTDAVHAEGGLIALQILHAGRYGAHPLCCGPSDLRARINPVTPRRMSSSDVWQTIDDIAATAGLAREAGYDGVEIMGSEGYLLNEFLAPATNDRDDEFGGPLENRARLASEVVAQVARRVGPDFLLIYRISAIDLVPDGLTGSEVATVARMVQDAGANVINTGIGWHESGVPTIAASVPRAAWTFATENVKAAVSIPVIASNRVNDPAVAEQLLADGAADLVSLARPFLADAAFAAKVRGGRAREINTCIACNQACLDRTFTAQTATCLVNPRAGRELELPEPEDAATIVPRRIAVVGAGPAGMACAPDAARRGHAVTLFESSDRLGGQLNLARVVPGKGEFNQLLRYFRVQLELAGVELRLETTAEADALAAEGFDHVVIATGVTPRIPEIAGVDAPNVISYVELLTGARTAGRRVAIIGAGGIGFDVAEYLLADGREALDPEAFLRAWSVDTTMAAPGGLTGQDTGPAARSDHAREVTMLQRTDGRLGRTLGRTTGWILKARLRQAGVAMIGGVQYQEITADGVRFVHEGASRLLEVDTVVLCAGQEPRRELAEALAARGLGVEVIGGADVAAELDAVRAIDQATRVALAL
jgi:2,4-dienoyl-CoA reductase (NADPH2)